jgi:hypothetical protein
MTETSTTPTPPKSCPPWCTADHVGEPANVATIHSGHAAPLITASVDGRDVHINVFLAGGESPGENRISVVHSGVGQGGAGYSGVALLTLREAPSVAVLLRVLGHVQLADALDRAVATLGSAS